MFAEQGAQQFLELLWTSYEVFGQIVGDEGDTNFLTARVQIIDKFGPFSIQGIEV